VRMEGDRDWLEVENHSPFGRGMWLSLRGQSYNDKLEAYEESTWTAEDIPIIFECCIRGYSPQCLHSRDNGCERYIDCLSRSVEETDEI
jgi:hypothetical protein